MLARVPGLLFELDVLPAYESIGEIGIDLGIWKGCIHGRSNAVYTHF